MLTKYISWTTFSVLLSLFVRFSQQNLSTQALLDGLGNNLNFCRLISPPYTSVPGGDAGLCHCSGVAPASVHTITYHEVSAHQLVLCMCPNAAMSAPYIIEMMGRVPYAI